MRRNRLRELMTAGKPSIATRLHSSWPSVVEAIGHTGMFDYVEFLAEYAPFDLQALDHFCRAAELHGMSAIIKVDQDPRSFLAQRAIGAGFQGVLFADCRSAQEVQECVRIVRPDTPQDRGTYGVGARRFAYMGYGGTPDYVQALRDVVVMVMIEKRSAVEQLEEILSIEGVDMVQWGPADYAMSLGLPGQRDAPEVRAAEQRVFETALAMGVPARAEITRVDQVARYREWGVRHFCIGTDLSILYDWWKERGARLRELLQEPE